MNTPEHPASNAQRSTLSIKCRGRRRRKLKVESGVLGSSCGFTLVELLAVVTIISILAALAIGIAGYSQRRAAVARTQAELAEMMRALEAYKLDYGAYPGGGLGDASSSTNVHKALTRGRGYMTFTKHQLAVSGATTNIVDPFGNNYRYRSDGSAAQRNKVTYDLWSTGPSPTVTNQWITNWQ